MWRSGQACNAGRKNISAEKIPGLAAMVAEHLGDFGEKKAEESREDRYTPADDANKNLNVSEGRKC